MFKKIKQGGVLGRNLKHAQTIKKRGMLLLSAILLMCTITIVDAGIDNISGEGLAGAATIATLPLFMVDNKFVELKGEDLTTFMKDAKPEQIAEYFNAKNEVSRKALNELIEKKDVANKEAIEALKTALKEDQAEQMKSLNETLKQYGLAIKKLTSEEKEARGVVVDSVKKGLQENVEKLKAMKVGNPQSTASANAFSFKAAGTMLLSTNVSGGNLPVEQRLAGLDMIRSRRVRLLDIITRGTAQSNIISWVSQANKDGAVGGTAEGATKNQIDFDFAISSETVVKRTSFIKVSDEMIDDVDFVMSEINNHLMKELLKDIENQVYQGDGIAPNMRGIRTVATAFAAGTFAATVDNANLVDVLRVAVSQIEEADQEAPNYILLRPKDVTKLMLLKVSTTDKRYIDALQIVAGQLMLDGIPILKTTLVTAGEYMVGNFDLATVYDKGEIMVEIGLDGNDFTKNLRTVRAEWRGATIVKTNDRTAFIKGVIATDAAVLETP